MSTVKTALKEAGWTLLISRPLIIRLTFITISILPPRGYLAASNCFIAPRDCIFAWMHFDVLSYIYVAGVGYGTEGSTAFFPLWPLLMHIVGIPLHTSTHVYYAIGIILSNLFFYFSLLLLYLLKIPLDRTLCCS